MPFAVLYDWNLSPGWSEIRYEEFCYVGYKYCVVQQTWTDISEKRNLLHVQGPRVSQARNSMKQVASKAEDRDDVCWLLLDCGVLSAELCILSCFVLVSFLAYSCTVKMEVICSTEILANLHQTTQCYIIQDRTLHSEVLYEPQMQHEIWDSEFVNSFMCLVISAHSSIIPAVLFCWLKFSFSIYT
jgi:hypothetical protein